MEAELGHYFLEGFGQSHSPRTESTPPIREDEARALQAELPASAVCLAPPPAPLEQCAVGALASGSSDSQVLVIDSLQGARQEIQVDAAPEQAEVSDGEAILQSDDEALLLGEVVDGTVRTRKRTDAGFDSDSGSETPRTAEAPLEASPSPPGGEDPLPQMPIPLPQMPGVNLQPVLARANSTPRPQAFVAPTARPAPLAAPKAAAAAAPSAEAAGWGLAVAGLAVGAHAGLAVAFRARAARQAETKPAEKSKYVETVADERLFEQVYLQYTSEYLKGPLYWHPDKLQGWLPDYPGTPMIKEGKYTSHVIGNLKAFSSNELAFLSMLFFGVGLYGNLQFNFYDPQWAKVDAGGFFNVSYIVESFLLPISFFMHIACYIQRQNGK